MPRPLTLRPIPFSRATCHAVPLVAALLAGLWATPTRAEEKPLPLRTFFVTRSLDHEQLLPYLQQARPQIVQIGNYGAMFHGYAENPKSTGWPMNLPVAGEAAALAFQRELNDKVHALGLRVVGHFRVMKVMGNWKEQTGFVEYYNQRWPEKLLGPKPHPNVAELLQRDALGEPIQQGRYNQSQLVLCLSSPHARTMLKRMLKVAIDSGCDGVNTNFNYHFGCVCPYCQASFKTWLDKRLSPAELQAKLGINDLERHTFAAIPAHIPGYPDPETATELDWLAARWAGEHFKRMFDEIFLDYGRSLKPDLLVATWNHLSQVSLKEERAFTPIDQWGAGEDFFWYSGGAAFVGKNLNLVEGKAGDAWLSALYVRELAGGKPFVLGKYDGIRLAASMAEGYATGGLGMGRYMRFESPEGFQTLARYTRFMHEHRHYYDGAAVLADAALVLPRQSVLNRRPASLDEFRSLGQALVERQVPLDVLVDQRLSRERLQSYRAVILPAVESLSDAQFDLLKEYAAAGGRLLVRGACGNLDEQGAPRTEEAKLPMAMTIAGSTAAEAADAIRRELRKRGGSVIDSPWTVRVASYSQPGRQLLHLVNYNRDEQAPQIKGNGPANENPLPVERVAVKLPLPTGKQVKSVTLLAPDREQPLSLEHQTEAGQVSFVVPRVLVYAVCVIEYAK